MSPPPHYWKAGTYITREKTARSICVKQRITNNPILIMFYFEQITGLQNGFQPQYKNLSTSLSIISPQVENLEVCNFFKKIQIQVLPEGEGEAGMGCRRQTEIGGSNKRKCGRQRESLLVLIIICMFCVCFTQKIIRYDKTEKAIFLEICRK